MPISDFSSRQQQAAGKGHNENRPFGGSISASVHFGGSNSACVHFGGSCLLKGSRSMRYREFGVSSLSDLSGIMTPGMYTEHALPTIWQQYH